VPTRGEFQQVDPISFINVLKDRAVLDRHRRKPRAHRSSHVFCPSCCESNSSLQISDIPKVNDKRLALTSLLQQTKPRGIILYVIDSNAGPRLWR
jgi:hypothetical protein